LKQSAIAKDGLRDAKCAIGNRGYKIDSGKVSSQ